MNSILIDEADRSIKADVLMITSLLEDILTRYEGRQRDALLPVLWDVQTAFGQIDAEAVHAISHTLRVPV